jgi:hypothetical protein
MDPTGTQGVDPWLQDVALIILVSTTVFDPVIYGRNSKRARKKNNTVSAGPAHNTLSLK